MPSPYFGHKLVYKMGMYCLWYIFYFIIFFTVPKFIKERKKQIQMDNMINNLGSAHRKYKEKLIIAYGTATNSVEILCKNLGVKRRRRAFT